MRFWIRGLGIRESGLNQDPYQEKYNFTSITRVPTIRIGHMMARLKGLSVRIIFSLGLMIICEPVAYSQSGQSPKIQIYGMMVLFRSGILC
jgi:hypothetical protein